MRVLHFCNVGDIIATLPALKTLREKTKRKIIFCQQLNVTPDYYPGAVHPVVDEKGGMVMCNNTIFNLARPLLLSQEYIHDMEIYNGQHINVNLNVIRKERFVNMPHQALQQWLFMSFPDMSCDITKPWIEIGEVDISDCYLIQPHLVTTPEALPDQLGNKIILNFTERYRNHAINYFFLKKQQNNLIFAGTENEYLLFTQQWELEIPRLVVKNFLQLAYILKQSNFLMCNQSFMWNLSFAMKTPHILELCEYADNCQAFTYEQSKGFLHQGPVEYFFKEFTRK